MKVSESSETEVNFTTSSSTLGNTYYSSLTRTANIKNSLGLESVLYCTTTGTSCTPNTSYSITPGSTSVTMPITFTSNASAQRLCVSTVDVLGAESEVFCDTQSFLVDTTAPTMTRLPSSSFQSTGDGIGINGAPTSISVASSILDYESGMWKYTYYYGTTSSNANTILCDQTTSTSCTKNLDAGTYYFKVVGYNNAGLTATSSVVPGIVGYSVASVCGYDCDYIQSKQGIASGDSVTIRADRSGFGGNPDISCSFANTSTGSAVTINYTKSCSRTSSPGGFEISCDIGFTMPAYNVTMTCDFVD